MDKGGKVSKIVPKRTIICQEIISVICLQTNKTLKNTREPDEAALASDPHQKLSKERSRHSAKRYRCNV
jgi:hypothetical protein